MAAAVYLLCAATSILCALLLYRSYRKSGSPLLFWSALCFLALAANNTLLLLDLVFIASIDLSIWRSSVALVGMIVLVYGLIEESR